ncbi:Histone deacetylase domain [Dillenia turbinata]|uniref:histone deacetylase n=1 Tax=Dillenia turbinata TaxID=194707 RepID=A0AAN8UUW4_9MAGN
MMRPGVITFQDESFQDTRELILVMSEEFVFANPFEAFIESTEPLVCLKRRIVGSMGAEGYSVNIPWSRGGVGDNDYIFAFQHIVLPIDMNSVLIVHEVLAGLVASEFAPDFTIISAGFDAARGDPLGGCDVSLSLAKSSFICAGVVTPAGYAQMTHMLNSLSGGKLLVILEGGYNLRSISSSATSVIKFCFAIRAIGHSYLIESIFGTYLYSVSESIFGAHLYSIAVLLGESPESKLENCAPSRAGLQTVLQVLQIQMNFWPLLESSFMKLQSQSKSISCQSSHKQITKRRPALRPLWWKLGRKRWLYNAHFGHLCNLRKLKRL